MTVPSEANLAEALQRACLWVDSSLSQFSLANASSERDELLLFKPIGELVLTAALLRQTGCTEGCLKDWLAWAWEGFDHGERLVRVLVARPDLIVLTSLYANFYELGYSSAALTTLAHYLAQSATCDAVELPKWRRLDVDLALQKLGIRPFPSAPQLGTWLEQLPEPWVLSTDIAYCITHEVFYLTDFGRASRRLSPEIERFVSLWLPAWIEIYRSQVNADLVAEFLMVSQCLRERPQCDDSFSWLLTQQDGDGMFRSPPDSGRSLLSPTDSDDRRRFLSNYHTTLVAIMALAMRLGHAR